MYLVARLDLNYGTNAILDEAMEAIVPIMKTQGWTLLGSYQTIIGTLTEVIDIWEIPDADAVERGLTGAYQDPQFGAAAELVAKAVRKETLSLVRKTSFSP